MLALICARLTDFSNCLRYLLIDEISITILSICQSVSPIILFSETPERVKRVLMRANLLFVSQPTYDSIEVEINESDIEMEKILSQINDGVDDR